MTNLTFKVFEDNGGGITMFVLDTDGIPVWAHSRYEYTPEYLLEYIRVLKDDDSVKGWEGNGMYDGCCFESWEDREISLEEYYEEMSSSEWVDLVADSEGIYTDNMGINAKEAFGIED